MKSSKISQPGNLTKEDAALIKEINLIAENALKRPVAGFSLGVMKDNRVILKRGYGFADLERKIPATAETRYQIGSITKQFTAAAILRLVEQKKINLDDEITKYLPEFSTQGHKVTIHHLLTHTSGIKNYSDYFFVLDSPVTTTPVAPQQILDSIKDKPFDFKPGERLAYNNSGYFLLGLIIERASGMPYAKFLEKTFFKPLKMTSTGFCGTGPNKVIPQGYMFNSKESNLVKAPIAAMSVSFAAGAVCSTVGDLLIWRQALISGKAISPNSLKRMFAANTGEVVDYGYGLWLSQYQGRQVFWHGGAISGFNSQFAYYPKENVTIILLANTFPAYAEEIERSIARKIFGIPEPKILDLQISAEERAKYLGTYDLKQFQMKIFEEQGKLKAQVVGEDSFRLMYQGDHTFVAEVAPDIRLSFRVENGQATQLTLDLRGSIMTGNRIL